VNINRYKSTPHGESQCLVRGTSSTLRLQRPRIGTEIGVQDAALPRKGHRPPESPKIQVLTNHLFADTQRILGTIRNEVSVIDGVSELAMRMIAVSGGHGRRFVPRNGSLVMRIGCVLRCAVPLFSRLPVDCVQPMFRISSNSAAANDLLHSTP